ncbi:MAG: cytochrome c [Gammaproteobacteria bacterium]|nr:cytochrome c [Gammaproteobacteria bacterium]
MKKLILAAAVALFASTAVANKMSLDNGEEAVAYRKATFSLLAANFGDLAARVNGKKAFDAAIVSQRVANVSALANMPWEAFAVSGSDKADSEALPEVWSKADDFAAAQQQFLKAVAELDAAGGDQKKLEAAVGAVGKSCKACHNSFKA